MSAVASIGVESPEMRDVLDLVGPRAGDVIRASRIAAGFASPDDARPTITGVRHVIDGDTLTIEATDSYRLIRFTLTGFDGAEPVDAIVPAWWITKQYPSKRLSMADRFVWSVEPGRFHVHDDRSGSTSSIPLIDERWPNSDALWGDAKPNETDGEQAAFNPKMLASIFAAASRWSDGSPIQCTRFDTQRPNRFKVVSGSDVLDLLIMPVRVP